MLEKQFFAFIGEFYGVVYRSFMGDAEPTFFELMMAFPSGFFVFTVPLLIVVRFTLPVFIYPALALSGTLSVAGHVFWSQQFEHYVTAELTGITVWLTALFWAVAILAAFYSIFIKPSTKPSTGIQGEWPIKSNEDAA